MANNPPSNHIISEFLAFLKKPFHYRPIQKLDQQSVKNLISGFAIVFVFEIIAMSLFQMIAGIEEIPHAFDSMMDMNPFIMILFAVIIAPVLEELIFRFPMKYITKYFPFFFYVISIGFALLHIFNFDLSMHHYLLAPFLVLPQLILGLYLGFVRMKNGILASMGIHALNNLIPILMLLFSDFFGFSF